MSTPVYNQSRQGKILDLLIRILLALIAAYFIVVNGTDDTIFTLLLDPSSYKELGFSFAVAMLLVSWIHYVSCRLDKKYQWENHVILRSGLQLCLGVFIPVLMEFLLVALYFRVFAHVSVLDLPFMRSEFRIVVLMIFFFNVYCITRYLYFKILNAQRTPIVNPDVFRLQEAGDNNGGSGYPLQGSEDVDGGKEVYIVHALTRSYPVPTNDIAYFYRDQGHVFMRQFNGEGELTSQSLDQIEADLNSKDFFRVARHMLVNHKAIVDYRPLTFGKLELTLTLPYKEPVRVSKVSAHNFRMWMQR